LSAPYDRVTIPIVLNLGGNLVRWYWSAYSFPELAPFSRDQRIQLVMRCKPKLYRRHRLLQIFSMLLSFSFFLFACFGPNYLRARVSWMCIMGLGGAILLTHQLELHQLHNLIKTVLPGHCGGCGYDLSGNTSGACPECGTSTLVQVNELPPYRNLRMLRWMASAIALAVNASALFLLVVLIVVAFFVIRNFIG